MSNAALVTAGWTRLAEEGEEGPDAYVAAPAKGVPAATVVVGMELFGVTAWVRKVCERFAEAGYVAVAPDFYWRGVRRAELGYDDAGRQEGFRLLGGLTREGVVADTAAAAEAGAGRGAAGGRAFVGFSLGGHFGVLAATRLPLDLVVSCYGGWTLDGGIPLAEPEPPLSVAGATAIGRNGTTVLGLVGDQDFLVTADEWQRLGHRLRETGVRHELHVHAGAVHGFMCEDRPGSHHGAAAEAAWDRILGALDRLSPRRD
ncbi:dienelactone hydrolase family protein [Streptomyces sp. NPDC006435]|uniref:dienelactone hydrolase family protein n=1 Tax=Streptomyces sp. NPDC006435 TaxID=3154300 RepID=UPI0033B23753